MSATVRSLDRAAMLSCMESLFAILLGPRAHKLLFEQLERRFSIRPGDILDKPTEFEYALEQMLGRVGSVLVRVVVRRWFEMAGLPVPRDPELLSRAVNQLLDD